MRGLLGLTLVALAAGGCTTGDDDGASTASERATTADSSERTATPDGSERPGPERPPSGAGSTTTAGDEPTLPPMTVTGTATDTIELTSEGSTLQFLPDRISAAAGTRVLLRYENGGDLPHNFALFRSDEAIDRAVSAAYEAEASGYVPPSAGGELIAYSPLISPGQTAEMELVVPPPGQYTYICLFPGHAQMMLGTLTSRE